MHCHSNGGDKRKWGAKMVELCANCSEPLGENAAYCSSCGVATVGRDTALPETYSTKSPLTKWFVIFGLFAVCAIFSLWAWSNVSKNSDVSVGESIAPEYLSESAEPEEETTPELNSLNESSIKDLVLNEIDRTPCYPLSHPVSHTKENGEKFTLGRDTLPVILRFPGSIGGSESDFNPQNFSKFAEENVFSAKLVKSIYIKQVTNYNQNNYFSHIVSVDLSDEAKRSPSIKQRLLGNSESELGVFADYCPGDIDIDNVSYTATTDSGNVTANFAWNLRFVDQFAENLYMAESVQSSIRNSTTSRSVPPISGSGRAQFVLMNDGWKIVNLSL